MWVNLNRAQAFYSINIQKSAVLPNKIWWQKVESTMQDVPHRGVAGYEFGELGGLCDI